MKLTSPSHSRITAAPVRTKHGAKKRANLMTEAGKHDNLDAYQLGVKTANHIEIRGKHTAIAIGKFPAMKKGTEDGNIHLLTTMDTYMVLYLPLQFCKNTRRRSIPLFPTHHSPYANQVQTEWSRDPPRGFPRLALNSANRHVSLLVISCTIYI